jgi:ferric-dicitrate binding protein FerR (iron transport regulator)
MATILSTLKLVQAKRQAKTDSVQCRRGKVLVKLDEQIALAKALRSGQTLNIKHVRKERDEMTGVLRTIESVKRIKQFWFKSESGKTCLELLYGQTAIEFKKGVTAIELADEGQVVDVLETLRKAVEVGELDAQITAASEVVKARFRR